MRPEEQARHERKIFRAFAADAGLNVAPKSIRSVKQPRPDIICQTDDCCRLAFELTQVVDKSLARGINHVGGLSPKFEQRFRGEGSETKEAIQHNYSNAIISLWPHDSVTERKVLSASSQVFRFLINQPNGVQGNLDLSENPLLARIFENILVLRCEQLGPLFWITPGGPIGDPLLESLLKKLRLPYRSDSPIDLLAYYDLQPDPLPKKLSEAMDLVRQILDSSSFRRVWIYSHYEHKLLGVYPDLEKGKTSEYSAHGMI
jgi:hypothetical protein